MGTRRRSLKTSPMMTTKGMAISWTPTRTRRRFPPLPLGKKRRPRRKRCLRRARRRHRRSSPRKPRRGTRSSPSSRRTSRSALNARNGSACLSNRATWTKNVWSAPRTASPCPAARRKPRRTGERKWQSPTLQKKATSPRDATRGSRTSPPWRRKKTSARTAGSSGTGPGSAAPQAAPQPAARRPQAVASAKLIRLMRLATTWRRGSRRRRSAPSSLARARR
mmetsp:Transcript_9498/g.31499  ORF Transcript_9498/g.31499 Transcript_9498/m.31499 type:complete len:222 (+) Transcript_9498:41-706(+)